MLRNATCLAAAEAPDTARRRGKQAVDKHRYLTYFLSNEKGKKMEKLGLGRGRNKTFEQNFSFIPDPEIGDCGTAAGRCEDVRFQRAWSLSPTPSTGR